MQCRYDVVFVGTQFSRIMWLWKIVSFILLDFDTCNMLHKCNQQTMLPLFTALRSSDENSVCPFVRWSVCHTRGLWQNGRKICPDLYTVWKNI